MSVGLNTRIASKASRKVGDPVVEDMEVRSLIHDMNNELMLLQGYMEQARMAAMSGNVADIEHYLADAQGKLLCMGDSFTHMLKSKYEEVNVRNIIRDMHVDMVSEFGVKLHTKLKSDLNLMTNKSEMRRLIVNVIKNASEAEAKNLTIIIHNNYLVFMDDGHGVDAETMAMLKNKITITTKDSGNGLGFEFYRGFAYRTEMELDFENRKGGGFGLIFKKY